MIVNKPTNYLLFRSLNIAYLSFTNVCNPYLSSTSLSNPYLSVTCWHSTYLLLAVSHWCNKKAVLVLWFCVCVPLQASMIRSSYSLFAVVTSYYYLCAMVTSQFRRLGQVTRRELRSMLLVVVNYKVEANFLFAIDPNWYSYLSWSQACIHYLLWLQAVIPCYHGYHHLSLVTMVTNGYPLFAMATSCGVVTKLVFLVSPSHKLQYVPRLCAAVTCLPLL